MAEATASEVEETNPTATVDMEVDKTESPQNAADDGGSEPNGTDPATNGESNLKREREKEDDSEEDEDGVNKKSKLEKSVEEERLDKLEEEEEEKSGPVELGYKTFRNSVEIFDYFYKILHQWPLHRNVNKYEHTMLLELLKKGHPEPDKKIGGGARAFQIRNHPQFKSKCFFVIREDCVAEDFSFRKCVDHILPLPEELQIKHNANKMLGGRGPKGRAARSGSRGGRGRGRGGKGGKFRH